MQFTPIQLNTGGLCTFHCLQGADMWCASTATSLLSIALLFAPRNIVQAEHQASSYVESQIPTPLDFTGLHTLSGPSHRAFKNQLKLQIQGDSCLLYHVAGTWWHYEWCVDRHVRQFHAVAQDQASSIVEQSILLGVYSDDEPEPLQVVTVDNLLKLAEPDRMGYMTQELYSQGDFCEESDAPRSVMVQVRCCLFRDNETRISLY
uniref:Protein OS9-like domain-containing protein n=1 Tax=Hyaloperonospora arabidopsidis (strain Emoy2) TaxID=559515 RepID=M4BK14_HYAAE